MVGGAVDYGLEQADQYSPSRHRGRLRLHRAAHIDGKSLGMVIADGDQQVVLDDEGHGRGFRAVVLATADEIGGHEEGVVLGIEPARRLDLGQFLTRRDVDAEEGLDGEFLLAAGIEQVDPAGAGRHRLAGLPRHRRQTIALPAV